ncbi:aspartate aminotransferase family protein [Ahrensia sp. R2A130]|uniref:aspartate aminotransferase family protein n=1 Tax=Ahrensia sp. R2A130 TaxID=744979 RepID=UPI0001E0E081|nr:aspartate aminotransferase family protein [Ahrensia sp. R2A130]EFL89823.1 acetylornithine aminotransferase [Ahrensia sp. R2A130]
MAPSSINSPLYPSFARVPLHFERGEGVRVWTNEGDEYLDFAAGIAVNALGHCHPKLIEALTEQAQTLWHVSNLFESPQQEKLARRLCENTFADRVFFTNSGTESMECAFKTARRYHYENGAPERVNIITFSGAFHGRSLAAITAGGNEKYMTGFGPATGGFVHLPFGDHEALKAAVDETTAAILIEPIQGEGGIRTVPHQCLRGLREMCDEHGILLIYDEVQCGAARTGKFFAHQWIEGAEPDIMAVAKGIGGGFPMGACLASEKVGTAMGPGTHGTTYGGNPLAMAVGNAVLDVVLEDGFMQSVQDKGIIFKQKLAALADSYPDLIEGVRGDGLIQGFKCRATNLDVVAAFREQNLLSVPAGDNVVRLMPPLIVSEDELSEAVDKMDAALSAMSSANLAKAG